MSPDRLIYWKEVPSSAETSDRPQHSDPVRADPKHRDFQPAGHGGRGSLRRQAAGGVSGGARRETLRSKPLPIPSRQARDPGGVRLTRRTATPVGRRATGLILNPTRGHPIVVPNATIKSATVGRYRQ